METRIGIDTIEMTGIIGGIGVAIERIAIGRIVTRAIDMIGIMIGTMNGLGEVAGGIGARVGIEGDAVGQRRVDTGIGRGIDLARGRTETGRGTRNDPSGICRWRLNRSCRI